MSTNFGKNWYSTNLPYEMYTSCALSSSGKFFTVISSINIYQGTLFIN